MNPIAASNGNHLDNGRNGHESSTALLTELHRCRETIAELADELRASRRDVERLQGDVLALKQASPALRWIRFFSHRLWALPQHGPIPLRIPPHYRSRPTPATAPGIAMVTPAFNQGQFLERTLRSVLNQDYPRLEYVVQDAGSQDGTVDLLRRHQDRLTHWASHPDRGQAHAINLGFRHATGEIMAYLNSDDLLLPGTLHYVGRWFAKHPEVDVVYGHRVLIDERDDEIGRWVLPPHDNRALGWFDFVPQETLFWRRRIWDKVGGALDESLHYALDWDLLIRFRDAGARFERLPRFLGAFRLHGAQKTSTQIATRGESEIQKLRERCQGRRVHLSEIAPNVRGYMRRHVLYLHLYRFGLLRY